MITKQEHNLAKMPPGYRRIGDTIYHQYDKVDIELGAAKELADRLRGETNAAGRSRYLDVKVVNKPAERGMDGRLRRYGRVFVARPEDNAERSGD